MSLARVVALISLVVLGASLLVGCGGGQRGSAAAGSPATSASRRIDVRAVADRKVGAAAGGGAVPGRSACTRAEVTNGVEAGLIRFSARCRGYEKGGPVDFVVFRPGLRTAGASEIASYSHVLEVRDSRRVAHRGACRLRGGTLECGVKVSGWASVGGQFRVSGNNGCAADVALVGVTVAACDGAVCEGSPVLHQLFRGRPEGCSHG